MPIQENAINAALADALTIQGNQNATPEDTHAGSAGKRCDIQVRTKYDDRYYTAIECKIGQNENQHKAAIKDAQRWLKHPECWNAIAVCYPTNLANRAPQPLSKRLKDTNDLHMVQVDLTGATTSWIAGSVPNLATLAADPTGYDTYAVTNALNEAIVSASNHINATTAKVLANTLQLPWEPKNRPSDPRPARIACLLIANMALLHNRLRNGRIVSGLESLIDILGAAANKQRSLVQNWQQIREVDYAPVVDPALAVLLALPTDHSTEEAVLGPLLEVVLDCAGKMRGMQLDHAGPLYHRLLETAKYEGSYYTSTAASVLLAELAMPAKWTSDWTDANRLSRLKICDPACGTGTLLMAAARTIENRYQGDHEDLEMLHLGLVEDVLHGFDINHHAIHLAACMLTLSAPKIDYNRMNLFNMLHGVNEGQGVRAGSLDILVDEAIYLPSLAPETKQRRATSSGYGHETPDVIGRCDLVIMNPPFTRNDIRNRSLPTEDRELVQQHEVGIAKKAGNAYQDVINQSTIDTFFAPIADRLLNSTGTLAFVTPTTTCTAPAARGKRKLLTDPERFHLELVVTSHDNRRIHFSENTRIHESLIVARRPNPKTERRHTTFVSLAENPRTATGASQLARAIEQALDGDQSALSDYGNLATRSQDKVRERPWTATCFYDQSLAEVYDILMENSMLAPLGTLAAVEPGGQRVRDAFRQAKHRQSPDMRALWNNQSNRQTAMLTEPDAFLVPKAHRGAYAAKLWNKRGHLLLANRVRLNLASTLAAYSENPILGSAFIPVVPKSRSQEKLLCRAWCVWLNSTFGVVAYLNLRQKQLTYPRFSLDGLRSLPVPIASCDIAALAETFDRFADKPLLPLPSIDGDPVREHLDQAIVSAVPNLSLETVVECRRKIPLEPTVNNEKEPFRLK